MMNSGKIIHDGNSGIVVVFATVIVALLQVTFTPVVSVLVALKLAPAMVIVLLP
jgi:hypothetical protein